LTLPTESSLATVVLAITAYLHHMGFLGLFAVFATILAILLGGAITGWMRTFCFVVIGHTSFPAFWFMINAIVKLMNPVVK
jgi:hypothetical protein